MKKQWNWQFSLPQMKFTIRWIWIASALTWLGLWLAAILDGMTWHGLLWLVMALHMVICVLLGYMHRQTVRLQEDLLRSQEMLAEAERINRELRVRRHDVINHLQVVYSLMQLGEGEEALRYLEKIQADFVTTRAVLRTADPAVNALLSAKKLQGEQRGLAMEMEIAGDLSRLPMESWEFCRILGNLLDNAMDAASQADKGRVNLHLREDDSGISFSVINNGAAIAPSLRERVFAPGFTTKGDRGSGMGLYIVRSLVTRYGGDVTLSGSGEQTCFTVYLPKP